VWDGAHNRTSKLHIVEHGRREYGLEASSQDLTHCRQSLLLETSVQPQLADSRYASSNGFECLLPVLSRPLKREFERPDVWPNGGVLKEQAGEALGNVLVGDDTVKQVDGAEDVGAEVALESLTD